MNAAAIDLHGIRGSQATILCIDGHKAALDMRAGLLQTAGYRVFAAATADEAMAIFVENEIDLVLADQTQGGVSAAELSIFMKQVRPGVAIVLLSQSSVPPAHITKHLDAYMWNDCTEPEVLSCIQDVLNRKASTGRYNGAKAS